MKKIIISVLILALIIGTGIWWYSNQKRETQKPIIENESNYTAERSSTKTEQSEVNESNNNNNTNNEINVEKDQNTTQGQQNEQNEQPKEEVKKDGTKTETEISSFTTKIYNKEKERQNNMSITCNALTNKEIKPGETFSFCDTVGKATTAKGYQKADIYVDGKKEKGLGGGNCQVSTTLYNAVTKVSGIEVTERHQHSGHVPYIQDGKDAAVAYGAYDLKFKNNTGSTIKIVMEKTKNNVTAKIIKID